MLSGVLLDTEAGSDADLVMLNRGDGLATLGETGLRGVVVLLRELCLGGIGATCSGFDPIAGSGLLLLLNGTTTSS